MRSLTALALPAFALSAAMLPAAAQVAAPAPAVASQPPGLPETPAAMRVLQPFVASYRVFHAGRELGTATLEVVPLQAPRWRVDLAMQGQGVMRLTGLNAQQSTLFEIDGSAFRPLTQATVRRMFLSRHETVGTYDWATRSARWSGDVKPGRAGPVALQEGDMSGLLIDLAVIRDAAPGRMLHYRFVDDGRTRDHVWRVAPQAETVDIGGISYDALRADRVEDGGDETILWVAPGVPTPIRILQREDGADSTDLRLVEYKGATS
ncbi:MAG TPA: DUF3108 domain-containing protein [Xanthomonadaceae bacterium]|nr:DUF3108 domain-containing protein [Xanthomonadaceae bacterium]